MAHPLSDARFLQSASDVRQLGPCHAEAEAGAGVEDDAALATDGDRDREGDQLLLLVGQGTVGAGGLDEVAEGLERRAAVLVQGAGAADIVLLELDVAVRHR